MPFELKNRLKLQSFIFFRKTNFSDEKYFIHHLMRRKSTTLNGQWSKKLERILTEKGLLFCFNTVLLCRVINETTAFALQRFFFLCNQIVRSCLNVLYSNFHKLLEVVIIKIAHLSRLMDMLAKIVKKLTPVMQRCMCWVHERSG
jgi:hypothetical protein